MCLFSVKNTATVFILLFLSIFVPTYAADIRIAPNIEGLDTSGTVVMSGEITAGDTESLVNLFMSLPPEQQPVSVLMLGPSDGGNLEETMNIGYLVKLLKWKVIVIDHCYSACSIIAMSSVYRVFAGEVGLHRPYFSSALYGELAPYYVEQWHRKMNSELKQYLVDAYVPEWVIERMMSTSSREMWTLTAVEANSVISNFPPYFEEMILARCEGEPVTIPEFGMNAGCLDRELSAMQRQSLITFLEAVTSN